MKKHGEFKKLGVCIDAVLSTFMCVLFDVLTRAARDTSHASVWLIVKKRLKECANKVNLDGRSMKKGVMHRGENVIK